MPYRGDNITKGVQFVGTGSTSFDGTNDYIVIADSSDFDNQSFTISAWVKLDENDDYNGIFEHYSSNSGYNFFVNSNGKLRSYIGDGSGSNSLEATTVLNTGQWYHCATTYTSGTRKIYLNGSEDKSATTSVTIAFASGNHTIGETIDAYMDGNIDGVAIWDTALDGDSIRAIWNNGNPTNLKNNTGAYDEYTDNLVAYYRCGDGTLDEYPLIGDEVTPTLGSDLIGDGTAEGSASFPTWEGAGSESNTSYNSTVSNSEDFANGGSKSFKVVNDGGGDVMNFGHSLNESSLAGNIYKVTCDVYIPTTDGVDSNITLRMLGTGGGEIQVVPDSGTNIALASTRDAWQSLIMYGQYVAHANSAIWNISSPDTGASEIFYVDNISIKQVNGNAGMMTNMASEDIAEDTP